jgi:hypothetical protein
MADFAFQRETRAQGQTIDRLFVAGEEAEIVFGKGTQIFPNLPVPIFGTTGYRMVADEEGDWFEVGFKMDSALNGNGSAGFTDPGNYFKIEIEQSEDLVNWNMGRFIPAAVPVVDVGGGIFEYWSRCTIPRLWKYVTLDERATSNRYGKSITAIHLFGDLIALPGYPYAMPSATATLQAHLIAAGYTGATVANTSAALSVGIKNHTIDGNLTLPVTLSGTNVTMVKTSTGTNISLPAYPYAMPSQRATLQSDLRAAGQSGAVVKLYGDEWEILIPNRNTILGDREFQITITPDDPFPAWDSFGTYLGNLADNIVQGQFENLRATTGLASLEEAVRNFARLKISSGTRYDAFA